MRRFICAGALVALSTACSSGSSSRIEPAPGELMVEVDLSEREMVVWVGDEVRATYAVAIGQPEHSTPTGTYRLSPVIWNPSWVPPNEAWASDKQPKAPGEPGNPMGRVKIFFSDQYYIHGTTDTASLGQPASHGCIRMRNQDATTLARMIMEHGGAGRSGDWYDDARANSSETQEVRIPNPPVLRVTD